MLFKWNNQILQLDENLENYSNEYKLEWQKSTYSINEMTINNSDEENNVPT